MNKKRITIILIAAMLANILLSIFIQLQSNSGQNSNVLTKCFANQTGTGSCLSVQNSMYAKIAGIPVAVLGIIGFSLLALLRMMLLPDNDVILYNRKKIVMLASSAVVVGALLSLWFLYVQAFILYTYCTYCLWADSITLASAVIFFVAYRDEVKQ